MPLPMTITSYSSSVSAAVVRESAVDAAESSGPRRRARARRAGGAGRVGGRVRGSVSSPGSRSAWTRRPKRRRARAMRPTRAPSRRAPPRRAPSTATPRWPSHVGWWISYSPTRDNRQPVPTRSARDASDVRRGNAWLSVVPGPRDYPCSRRVLDLVSRAWRLPRREVAQDDAERACQTTERATAVRDLKNIAYRRIGRKSASFIRRAAEEIQRKPTRAARRADSVVC
jgi:hypothetical protein